MFRERKLGGMCRLMNQTSDHELLNSFQLELKSFLVVWFHLSFSHCTYSELCSTGLCSGTTAGHLLFYCE